jgi:hypothetical protein
LSSAIKEEEAPMTPVVEPIVNQEPEITEYEWQAFYLVKSILMGTIDTDRIYLRNASGTGRSRVLLDNSNLKPVIWLDFIKPGKSYIELIGPNKEKTPYDITKVDDILGHADAIRETVKRYDDKKEEKQDTAI